MRRTRPNRAPLLALLIVAVVATGCAGNLRDNMRKGALYAGEAVLTLDQTEQTMYKMPTPGYTAEKHKEVGNYMVLAIGAVQTYVRAVDAWPENMLMPNDVPGALKGALDAIDTLKLIVEAVPAKTDKLQANLQKIREKLGGK